MSNCWLQWWFDFETIKVKISSLPFVDSKKLNSLWIKIDKEWCVPHDWDFTKWGWIIEYIKANYKFALTIMQLLHWTSPMGRLGIFLLVFTWTTIFWYSWFNFTKVF